jgi:hypothetical protein
MRAACTIAPESIVILTPRSRLSSLFVNGGAAAFAAASAWISLGTLGVDVPGGARIGLLPTDAWSLAIAISAGACVLILSAVPASRRGPFRSAIPLIPLVLVWLPWIPLHVPAAFLLWAGPLASLAWIATAIALAFVAARDSRLSLPADGRPRSAVISVSAATFLVVSAAAWFASPSIPGGDEPHYLVITQSLLSDGDLRIENNHRRGDYRAYFAGELNPDFIRRGRNGQVYSIHAPGLPAFVAPAFAVGGYHGVVVFLILIASLTTALAWWLSWRVTGSAQAACVGCAAVALSPPFLLESFTVYPDGVGAALVLTGFWALLRADWERQNHEQSWTPWLLYGAALAALPWMHTRFSVLAATLGGLILLRLAKAPNAPAKAVAFLAVPAVSAFFWLAYFLTIYGTPDPSAPYGGQTQTSFAYLPNGIGGLLFDQGFGVLATAPVLLLAVPGFLRNRRLLVEWLIVTLPYLAAVASFAMWWAGWSAPGRFLVPILLPLAIAIASGWTALRSRDARALACAALVVTGWLSIVHVGAGGGRLGFHTRNDTGLTPAPWTTWAAHLVDLPSALPAFVPLPFGTPVQARNAAARSGAGIAALWAISFVGAAVALIALGRRRVLSPEGRTVATTMCLAAGAMTAASIAWRVQDVDPLTPAVAQLDLLRAAGSGRAVAVDLSSRQRLTLGELAGRIRIQIDPAGGGRGNRPLAAVPALPAGEYEVKVDAREPRGWLMTGIGNDQFALATEPVADLVQGTLVRFPVDVRALIVRGDEDARASVTRIAVRPLRLLAPSAKAATDTARRAVRYSAVRVFYFDDRSFPEPNGFWVGGARSTRCVLAPDNPTGVISLVLRNAPVENVVTLTAGKWRQELHLDAGEERRIDVPLPSGRGAAPLEIASAAGFRPSERDPGSRDTRFLGAYVTLAAQNRAVAPK